MTNEELSNRFDTLIQIYTKNERSIIDGLNEYEKSVLFTEAQELVIKAIYNGSFEKDEKSMKALQTLISDVDLSIANYNKGKDGSFYMYEIPVEMDDFLFVLKDSAKGNAGKYIVKPISQDSLESTLDDPFRCPNSRRVVKYYADGKVRLYSKDLLTTYKFSVLTKPSPIIFGDLENNLYICGCNSNTEIAVDESIHNEILNKAVELAINARQ